MKTFLMSKTYKPSFRLFLLSSFLILASCNDRKEAHEGEASHKLDSLSQVLQEKKTEVDSLKRRIERDRKQEAAYPVVFGREFNHIENPEKYIIRELHKNKEKIPLDGVLGGTMEFRYTKVLSDKWIFAIYDDGHVQGKAIYEYKLNPNDSLSFSLIVSDNP